ncbi:MAG: phenylalanine--tRNA ligase subunit beta [Anaeromicrobium sp.]|uniref:phenylalanine--tRNA ligase subunit beta n=1 Tax=Anaeromicrobium sp. TaxID=1929132 RepID=UPI0025EF835E|nr:phenylalanine--tRNA ligase subunit beta [Anaeromicrobium sp.]MCT4594097.1 phenylalanine--tRNA ligase subunit beta [Anaeromicrobium sp.]
MLVSLNWLNDYVDLKNLSVEEIRDGFIMSGSNIETVENPAGKMNKIVVGKILEIKKHPDANSLIVTQVDVGEEVVQIVTGADNVKEGDYIPVILSGGRLPDGTKIKKGKLRGVVSNGMMCSGTELGIGDNILPTSQNKDGIYIFNKEYPLGSEVKEIMGLDDSVMEFEITFNRPDCLSVIGMAREARATFNVPMKYPEIRINSEVEDANDYMKVEVENKDLCDRFVGRVIKNVKIEESPEWLQNRLMRAGIRPISNIVDITNFVMLEFGQPMHAYDIEDVEDRKIIVRNAKAKETIKTLDGQARELNEDILLICDGKKPVGIAGVMGGENTEIKDSTKTIFLEAAHFNKDNIRKTSKDLGLRTEASSRFEKGVDPNTTLTAANRFCQLVEQLGAGEVVGSHIDIYENKTEEKTIKVRSSRINGLLGTKLSNDEMVKIFESLEFKVKTVGEDFEVTVPTYRGDMIKEIDFVEEIARIYGYDKLETTLYKDSIQGGKTPVQSSVDILKDTLNGAGLNEILTYSFVSPSVLDNLCVNEESSLRNVVKVINPLGEETSVMRTTLMGNMIEVLGRNYNKNVESARAFECGNTFIPGEDILPSEKRAVTMGMYGKDVDFFSLKGVVERVFSRFGIDGVEFVPEKSNTTFHPGRCANVLVKGVVVGTLGELHPNVCENYKIGTRVYVSELDFEAMINHIDLDKGYTPLPKYPAMTRDFAIVVKEDVYVKDIQDVVTANGGGILESITLFDVYRGKQVEEGHKSIAYSLVYRAKDRTLTDEEVTKVHNNIIKELEEKIGGSLRD